MRHLRPPGRDNQPDDINLSPLIDMTFLLLIFFMVTTSFVRESELRVERPGARAGEQARAAVRVVIDRDRRIDLEGQRVDLYLLQTRLRPLLAQRGDRRVVVVADRRLATEDLIAVVDQCRLAGAEPVAVAVESPPEGR